MLARTLLLFVLGTSLANAAPTLTAPANAPMGSEISITVAGTANERDFVTIVPKGAAVGTYDAYQYASAPGVLKLRTPAKPGDYEIRWLGAESPYPTLVTRPLKVETVTASLEAPAQVAAGAKFEVRWKGPNNDRDYVAIGNASQPYLTYEYTQRSNPVTLTAPEQAGSYELRYFLGYGDKMIFARPLTVGSVSASVSAPAQVAAGSKFAVTWKGPNNANDFITVVKAGAPEKTYERYDYTNKGNPLELLAPDQPGDYEVRYLTGQGNTTLASAKFTIGAISASLQGPATAVAGSTFPVTWKGPNSHLDYITIVSKGAGEGQSGNYEYTANGNPATLLAPLAPGDYELRYSTGQSHTTLARAAVKITPAKQEPGLVAVTVASTAAAGSNAVEIILDASGSMLQRIGSQRRIDIAKQTLTKLTSATIPAGTPFALRVFGRELDSCQTDLEIPLGPLDAAAVGARITALEAKNGAKTPIGASLEKVTTDLQKITGERLVVLVTDGEETCGGDPAAAIEKLKKAGTSVRVNIVGFAIDDPKLAATFRHWSDLGSGMYFDAKDAAGLGNALAQAMRPGFEIVNAQNRVVADGLAGGEPVRVPAGDYTVRLQGQKNRSQPVTVKPKETAAVRL